MDELVTQRRLDTVEILRRKLRLQHMIGIGANIIANNPNRLPKTIPKLKCLSCSMFIYPSSNDKTKIMAKIYHKRHSCGVLPG